MTSAWDDEEEDFDDAMDRWREREDERKANHGTAECDNTCDPTCDWCLMGHVCPDECGGGAECPYVALERSGK